jgi:peptide/nickel transport system ATP-binding protein
MSDSALPKRFPLIDRLTGPFSPLSETADTVSRNAPPLLKVRNLVKQFNISGGLLGGLRGRVHAVENVTLDIQPGEALSLVGNRGVESPPLVVRSHG